jgi:hypothetical protein
VVEWGTFYVSTQRLAILTCGSFALSFLAQMPDIPKKYAKTTSFSARFFTAVNKSTLGQAMLQNVQPTAHTHSLKQ